MTKNHLTEDSFKSVHHAKWLYNFIKVRGWLHEPIQKPFYEQSDNEIRQESLSALANSHRKFEFPGPKRLAPLALFEQLTRVYESSFIEPSEYAFISKLTPRIQNLIWIYIRNLHAHQSVQNEIYSHKHLANSLTQNFIHYLPAEPIYPYYTLIAHPLTHVELTKSIMDFISLWEADSALKREHLEKFRFLINEIKKFTTAFRWLNANDQYQCEWAYNYLKYRNILQNSFPISAKKQSYDAIVASFDYWDGSYEAKKLLLTEMRRAWSTQKFRDKQVNKKSYNFTMCKKMAKMLDNLSKELELSKSEVVEKLIMKAHSDLQDKRRFN